MDYYGGGRIKRQMLLTMFIICGIVLICLGSASAADSGNNATNITVDPVHNYAGEKVNLTANVTSNNSSIVNEGSVKFSVNGIDAGSAPVSSGKATLEWLIPANWNVGSYNILAIFDGTGTYYNNSTNSSTLTVDTPIIKGYWMRYDDLAPVSDLISQGITDVFLLTRGVNGAYHLGELQWAINNYKPYGINVHAWIVCFKDDNQFVNPSGYYSYTRQIYVTTTKRWGWKATPYKVKKKVKWKKVGKRWLYKYTYVTKYRYKKGWIYTPIYRYETVSGYDKSYSDRLVNEIASINNNYNIDGVHLDYVRYSGVGCNAANQQPGGTNAAVDTIANFVQKVRGVVTKQLSAAVMPERWDNSKFYAQDYDRLADYLNFIVSMSYQGNYNANQQWITDVNSYIVNSANSATGKIPVYAGLTTYWSDDNTRYLSHSELQNDIYSAKAGGASGFVLFRYGYGCNDRFDW